MTLFPSAVVGMSSRKILRKLLECHFHQPAICLFRSLELTELRQVEFSSPVLDLGCGNGDIAEIALSSHTPVVGLDLLHVEASVAAKRTSMLGAVTGDATSLPFEDNCYGAVVSICVFEHIPADELAIAEVARVLRDEGLFVFSTPSTDFEQLLIDVNDKEAVTALNQRLGHFHYRSLDEWRDILSRNGLSIQKYVTFLPPRSARIWHRLDRLMVSRIFGRRILDVVRGLNRRGMLPVKLWAYIWSVGLSVFAQRRVKNGECGAGQLIIAKKISGSHEVQ
tara:strand:- start:302 stop:1141 length:840 start_codon:yes stop_codon:yes gene_type:complete